MNILIFGATGRAGNILTAQSLSNHHQVTAFVRDPSKMKPEKGLTIVTGEVTDYASVLAAFKGHTFDAVLSVLGSRKSGKDHLVTIGTTNIVKAMEQTGHKRLLVLSSLGVGEEGYMNWFTQKIIFGMILKSPEIDMRKMDEVVRASSLDYTLIRPPRLLNTTITGDYRVLTSPPVKPLKMISKADVVQFMLLITENGEFIRQAVAVGY